jgi:glycine betaine/proline transport system substrate-binding protein
VRRINRRSTRLSAITVTALFALSACGGGTVAQETSANEANAPETADCGDVNIAVHPWVGYEANAYVLGHVAAEEFGCTVNYVEIKEGGPSYEALKSGDIDMILEEWSHAEELAASVAEGSAVDLGATGNVGIIGWYVPGWLAEEYPEVLDTTTSTISPLILPLQSLAIKVNF